MSGALTISELVARSHDLAKSKGWWETWPDGLTRTSGVNVPEKLALIHSEVSEALEAYRAHGVSRRIDDSVPLLDLAHEKDGFTDLWSEGGGKPEGFVVELADAVIRIADLCGALGLDLAQAIECKHRYNASRPYRHGGKRA